MSRSRAAAAVTVSSLGTSPRRARSRSSGAWDARARADQPLGDVAQAPRAASAPRREPRIALRRRPHRRGLGPHGSPDEHAARPGSQAVSTCASNVASSTPPDSSTQGSVDASSSSAHASAQRPRSVSAASYGNSALRTSPPSGVNRRAVSMTTRRLASPVSFSPSTTENDSGSTNSARSSARQAAATSATSRSWSAAFAASGW